jgi:hypothetical protein
MSAYIVFTRTKTLDQKELETYWAGIKATMKGYPIEVLVAYGQHEVLEGDPIEGIVDSKIPNRKGSEGLVLWRSIPKCRQTPSKRSDLPRPNRRRCDLAFNVFQDCLPGYKSDSLAARNESNKETNL